MTTSEIFTEICMKSLSVLLKLDGILVAFGFACVMVLYFHMYPFDDKCSMKYKNGLSTALAVDVGALLVSVALTIGCVIGLYAKHV